MLRQTPPEQNILLIGRHGIGKSEIITRFFREERRMPVIAFFLGQMSDPGDLIGLQSGIMGEARHTVTAVTDTVLCTFPRNGVWELFRNHPPRAYDLTWIAAIEEHFLGETVATLGQRDATQRIAWALSSRNSGYLTSG